jgi:serine/threonine protein kinase
MFNGDVKEWTPYSRDGEEMISSRKELIENLNISQDDTHLCNINTNKRIGSESTMAQVFEVEINNYPVAVKVLPITSKESYSQIENEVNLARLASQFVLEDKSIYFPIVYGGILCPETYFYNGAYYEKSRRFQEYEYLLSLTNDEKKISQILSYKKKFVDASVVAKKVFLAKDLLFTGKVKAYLLFSELASYDLKYYLQHNTLTIELIKDIFKAIYDLHTKLNIVHNDLHLGNILIKGNQGNLVPLIHDFGKSYISDFESEYDRKDDLLHILNKLIELNNNLGIFNPLVKDYLTKGLDIVHNSNRKYVIEELF